MSGTYIAGGLVILTLIALALSYFRQGKKHDKDDE